MPQAIEVVGQSEQGGLALLHRQATSRGAGGEFAFDDGEDRFHLGSLPVGLLRKSPAHLSANAHATAATTRGWNDAARSQPFANVSMVLFGVKFGVGQHQADWRNSVGRIHQIGQTPAIAPGCLPSALRQNDQLVQIGDDQPLQPITPARHSAWPLLDAANKKGAGGVVAQPCPSTATRARRRVRRLGLLNRRAASPSTRSIVWSSSRCRKRYKVV